METNITAFDIDAFLRAHFIIEYFQLDKIVYPRGLYNLLAKHYEVGAWQK